MRSLRLIGMRETDVSMEPTGLERVTEILRQRFGCDDRGRFITSRSGDTIPRFVLARSREGCLWRFRHDLVPELVSRLSRLAGREGPLPRLAADEVAPPERLHAIQALLDPSGGDGSAPRREGIEHQGVLIAELWLFD